MEAWSSAIELHPRGVERVMGAYEVVGTPLACGGSIVEPEPPGTLPAVRRRWQLAQTTSQRAISSKTSSQFRLRMPLLMPKRFSPT
jgi:hypothetical protein